MKKDQKARRELEYLEKQFPVIKRDVKASKSGKLWRHETVIRKKIKALRELRGDHLKGYGQVYDGYVELLGEVSERLLENYNQANATAYGFSEVVQGRFRAYLNSGIISVLVTHHIPKMVAAEFNRLLPENPKDGYPEARGMKRRFVLHLGETNTGKTYSALQCLKQSESGVYLAPLRILALENFERLNSQGVPCSLVTGEEEILVEGARHSSRTVEKAELLSGCRVAVIDEVQMLRDPQRGDAWTRAILGLCCPEIHLCGAMHAREQLVRMIQDCGDDFEILEYTRSAPLQIKKAPVRLSDVRKGDALVAFSKRRVLSLSRYYSANGIPNSVIYGDLPPEVRRGQYEAFIGGESQILVATDAIGMGVNLPIRRIVFTETSKFDGEMFRPLFPHEVKQIAGRAGRIGIYDVGYVACMGDDVAFIKNCLQVRDEEIDRAVVGPSEEIMDIGLLPLKEKLALWETREETVSHYRKKDIRDAILILDRLKAYRLPEKTQWRLMQLPFDVNSEELLAQFIRYVEERFVLKAEGLSRPDLSARSLPAYEQYYQKVGLYYSFSKSLGLPFDEQWVYDTRKQISEEISRLL
ncbi:MAG TPA: RNA helicase [Clostridiales bacterium]|nr:RNA helicase [Clostridiales bacterium]